MKSLFVGLLFLSGTLSVSADITDNLNFEELPCSSYTAFSDCAGTFYLCDDHYAAGIFGEWDQIEDAAYFTELRCFSGGGNQ